jgi:hypothetical protein
VLKLITFSTEHEHGGKMNNITVTNKNKKFNITKLFNNINKINIFKKRVKKEKIKKFNDIYDKDLLRKEIISLGFVPRRDDFNDLF